MTFLNKHSHISDRARVPLRGLWMMPEQSAMECLIDGGFLTDVCLDRGGAEVQCAGTLNINYRSAGGQEERKLLCSGTTAKGRHKLHWLTGSIFQGHTKLNAGDVVGVIQAFAGGKNTEVASMDTGLHRNTVRPLLDRLRMAAAMVAIHPQAWKPHSV